jgi:molecular chaperone Hsp33
MLAALGPAQMREMLEEDGQAEVNCSFCNSVYEVSREELEEQIARAESGHGGGSAGAGGLPHGD